PVKYQATFMFRHSTDHTVAIFRQINKGALHANHDALEFPDGKVVLLTRLYEGQNATVLTLPTRPKTAAEADSQQRIAYVGWHPSSCELVNKRAQAAPFSGRPSSPIYNVHNV